MAAPKRSRAQRAADFILIEELSLKGKSETQIAEAVSDVRPYTLSRQQIGYDLRKLAKKWQAEAVGTLDEFKAKALAEVRQLQLEYWQAWERSCQDAETETRKQRLAGEGEVKEMTKVTKGQAGDKRFLDGVQWCIERRCKILGIDAPNKTDLTSDGKAITFHVVYEE
jgi:hypothetical protein